MNCLKLNVIVFHGKISLIKWCEFTPNFHKLGCNFQLSGEHFNKGCQFWRPFFMSGFLKPADMEN